MNQLKRAFYIYFPISAKYLCEPWEAVSFLYTTHAIPPSNISHKPIIMDSYVTRNVEAAINCLIVRGVSQVRRMCEPSLG